MNHNLPTSTPENKILNENLLLKAPVTGALENYEYVGYIAMGMSVVAVLMIWKLKAVD